MWSFTMKKYFVTPVIVAIYLNNAHNDIVQGKFLLIQNAIHLMMLPNLNSNEPIREAADFWLSVW